MFELNGVFDLHVHANPCLLPRIGDDLDFAKLGKEYGMAGIAVKAHLESTASRAYYVNKLIEGFRYVGGICLNYPVGGINPAAVDACLRMGGRIVWMPSAHSKFHAKLKGELGNWKHSGMKLYNPPGAKGITILDESNQLTSEIKDVVRLVKENNALIGTSHLSPEEIVILTKYCKDEKVKIILNHLRWVPEYSLELGKEAIKHGAYIELTATTLLRLGERVEISEVVGIIKELGVNSIVIGSDAGGVRSPSPAEALRVVGNNLLMHGMSEADLKQMMCIKPIEVLDD